MNHAQSGPSATPCDNAREAGRRQALVEVVDGMAKRCDQLLLDLLEKMIRHTAHLEANVEIKRDFAVLREVYDWVHDTPVFFRDPGAPQVNSVSASPEPFPEAAEAAPPLIVSTDGGLSRERLLQEADDATHRLLSAIRGFLREYEDATGPDSCFIDQQIRIICAEAGILIFARTHLGLSCGEEDKGDEATDGETKSAA